MTREECEIMYGEQILRLRQYIRGILKDDDHEKMVQNANTILRVTWQEIQERLIPEERRGYIAHLLDWDSLIKMIDKPVWFDVGYESANNHWMILRNVYTGYDGKNYVADELGHHYPLDDIALYDNELFHEKES